MASVFPTEAGPEPLSVSEVEGRTVPGTPPTQPSAARHNELMANTFLWQHHIAGGRPPSRGALIPATAGRPAAQESRVNRTLPKARSKHLLCIPVPASVLGTHLHALRTATRPGSHSGHVPAVGKARMEGGTEVWEGRAEGPTPAGQAHRSVRACGPEGTFRH